MCWGYRIRAGLRDTPVTGQSNKSIENSMCLGCAFTGTANPRASLDLAREFYDSLLWAKQIHGPADRCTVTSVSFVRRAGGDTGKRTAFRIRTHS